MLKEYKITKKTTNIGGNMTAKELKYQANIDDKFYFVKKLNLLGIEKRYMGYFFLIEIMNILINEMPDRVVSFSRQVYPLVAERYHVSVCSIERDIRNVIEKSWSFDMMTKLKVYYSNNQKPTCRDFIFMIKNYMVRQLM